MAVTEYDRQNLSQSDQKQLQKLTGEWNYYNAIGDRANMDAVHAEAEKIRNQGGYTSDASGALSGSSTIGDGTNTGSFFQNAGDKAGGSAGYSTGMADQISALYDAKKQAAIANLKAAIEKQVSGYQEQMAGLESTYDPLRAQSEVERYKSGAALRESLANSGELYGGQGRQDMLNLQNAYASALNKINLQQEQERGSLARAIADARSQGSLQEAALGGEYDAAMLAALLEQQNSDRAFAYQQQRDQTADSQWDKTFQYQQQRDQTDDYKWDKTFQYQKDRDAVTDARYDDETAYNRTVTERQLAMQQAELESSIGQQKFQQAYSMLQSGIATETAATALGIPLAEAKRVADYVSAYNNAALEGQRIANQTASYNLYAAKSGAGSGSNRSGSSRSGSSTKLSYGEMVNAIQTSDDSLATLAALSPYITSSGNYEKLRDIAEEAEEMRKNAEEAAKPVQKNSTNKQYSGYGNLTVLPHRTAASAYVFDEVNRMKKAGKSTDDIADYLNKNRKSNGGSLTDEEVIKIINSYQL